MGSLQEANIVGFVCRICMELHKIVLHVFGDRGQRLQLAKKIAAYMLVKITVEDSLPKTICLACVERVEYGFAKLSAKDKERAIVSLERGEVTRMTVIQSDIRLSGNEFDEWHVFTTTLVPRVAPDPPLANGNPYITRRRRVFAFISPAVDHTARNMPRRTSPDMPNNSIW